MHEDQYEYAVIVALDEEARYFTQVVTCGPAMQLEYSTGWPIEDPGWREFGRGVIISSGKMGKDAAKAAAAEAHRTLGVTLLANIGIAGRVHPDRLVGDVVVPSLLYDLTTGGKIAGKPGSPEFLHMPIPRELPSDLIKVAKSQLKPRSSNLRRIHKKLKNRFATNDLLSHEELNVVFDPLACVPAVGANAEYRDSIRQVDRSIAAMDMESAGVIETAKDMQLRVISVRGISDGADYDKSKFEADYKDENRRLAMEAAIAVLEVTLRAFHDLNSEERPVPGIELSPCDRQPPSKDQEHSLYERLFSLLVRTKDGDLVEDPIKTICRYLSSNEYSGPLVVFGDKGAGKTTLLRRVRSALADRIPDFHIDPARPCAVILIEIGLIEVWGDGEIDEDHTRERLTQARRVIRAAVEKSRADDGVLFAIIDGLCQTGSHSLNLISEVLEELDVEKSTKILLSAESRSDIAKLYATSHFPVDRELEIHPLDIDDPKSLDLAEAFAQVNRMPMEGVLESMRAKEVRSLDPFLMARFFSEFRSTYYSGLTYLSEFYALFCAAELSSSRRRTAAEAERAISEVAATAFEILIARSKNFSDIRERDTYRLISSHPSVTSFLVARHVVDCICAAQRKSSIREINSKIGYVFPSEVNSHTKQMVLSDKRVENKVIEFIKHRYGSLSVLAQSHCAYLAGRVSEGRSAEMLQTLREMTEAVGIGRPMDHDRRMLRRTIYISRSMLADREAVGAYAEILLTDVDEAEFNRGFHLEYYGDAEFDPNGKMVSRDEGVISCNRTFSRLRDCILGHRPGSRLPLIELLTLLSLVQVRNVRGTLRKRHREQTLELLRENTLRWRSGLSPKIRGYLGRMEEDLALPAFNLATVLDDWWALSAIERSGWLRRRSDAAETEVAFWRRARVESVAEHTFSSLALAMVFLQDEPHGEEVYDKRRILEMLLVHDLAEGRVGDRLPGNSDPDLEQKYLWEYAAFSTYKGVSKLWHIPELFQEFTAGQSLDSRVAQDLDRLQFLMQSRYYGNGLNQTQKNLCEETVGRIGTDTGIGIYNLLEGFPGPTRFESPVIISPR